MKNFSSEIPKDLQSTPNTAAFIKVLDNFLAYKRSELAEVEALVYPNRASQVALFEKYFKDINLPTIEGLPKSVYENMINNAHNLYKLRGTSDGLKLLAKCLWLGDIAWDMANIFPQRYFIPSDFENGYFPNGEDLGFPNTPRLLYLYGGDVSAYYGDIEFRLLSPLFRIPAFRQYVADVLPRFLPLIDPNTTNITIKFYGHSFVGAKLLNYKNI
jgi:hypothetical protein